MRERRDDQGFTLVELAVVLLIISLVTGMAITSGISVVSTARISATQQKMKAIDQALLMYRDANGRLPCPGDLTKAPGSTDYGLEAGADVASAIGVGTGVCTGAGMLSVANFKTIANYRTAVAEGGVPVTTLGLPNDFMYDGWGNHFRYAVNINMTSVNAFALTPAPAVCGAIGVNDVNGSARTVGAIYALISHGANGHGAYSRNGKVVSAGSVNTNELANCHCTSSGTAGTYGPTYVTYVQDDPSSDPSNSPNSFDDIVMYKEYWQTQTDAYPLPPPKMFTVYLTTPYDYVQMFTSYGAYTYKGRFGSFGTSGNGGLNNPQGVAVDAGGNVWVADWGNYWVYKFSPSGSFLSQIGSNGYANGNLRSPWGVAIDSTGNIWVTETSNNRVQQFTSSGTWLQTIPSSGCGNVSPASCTAGATNGQFNTPRGIAIDSGGNIWVADSGNNRIEEFSSSGTYINSIGAGYNGISGAIGSSGLGSGQFNLPEGIAIDSSNNIWVADYNNNRVQELNSSGSFLNGIGKGYNGLSGSIGAVGFTSGGLQLPNSVAVSPDGAIFVSDTGSLHIYSSSLQFACTAPEVAPAFMQGVAFSTSR